MAARSVRHDRAALNHRAGIVEQEQGGQTRAGYGKMIGSLKQRRWIVILAVVFAPYNYTSKHVACQFSPDTRNNFRSFVRGEPASTSRCAASSNGRASIVRPSMLSGSESQPTSLNRTSTRVRITDDFVRRSSSLPCRMSPRRERTVESCDFC